MKINFRIIFPILLFYILPHFSQAQEAVYPKVITNLSKKDSVKVDVLSTMFFDSVYSNIEKSRTYYKQIFAIAKKNKSNYSYTKGYNFLGIICDLQGKFDSAKICYKKSLYYSKTIHSKTSEASAYNNLGLIDWNEGNFSAALIQYQKALIIFEKLNKQQYVANVLSNIGEIYSDLDDLKKSEFYIFKSFEIRKKIDDEYGMSVSLINLANLYHKKKQYSKAIKNYESGILLKRKLEDLLGIATANTDFSVVLLETGQVLKAKKVLEEALKICKENDAESNILENTYLGLSEVYIDLKQLQKAKMYNQNAFLIIKKLKDSKRLLNYYTNEEKISLLEKDFKRAHLYLVKQDSLSKIIEGIELKKAIHLYETKYQTEKKEKELLKSKAIALVSEAEIKKKNFQFILLFIFIFGILLISYLIYRQQKLKHKQQEQEFELKSAISKIENQNKLQEQRLNISRDLHDNIGSQLTFIISSVDNVKYAFDIDNTKLDDKLTNISSFAKETIVELRDTIWAMNSNEISFEDLESRIHNFIEKAKEVKDDIQFSFAIDWNLKDIKLTSVEGMNIYRTIQEAVNNAIKYANASTVSIAVKRIENQIQITIQDNGIGFDESTIQKGNGLKNMQKRIEDISGKFHLIASPEGTKITVLI
jgi:signal transduction histidine kinase